MVMGRCFSLSGAEDGLIPSTPISSIKKCFNGDKVVQVIIKFRRERFWDNSRFNN